MKPIDDENAPVVVDLTKEEEKKEEETGPVLVANKVHLLSKVEFDNLPSCSMYERSYMHKDTVTHSTYLSSCGIYYVRGNC